MERHGVPVFTALPDSAQYLMDTYGLTAEQAGDGSPDLVWLLRENKGEARPYVAGDRLPVGVEVFPGHKPNDNVLWIESHRAVVAGDTLADFGDGPAINTRWLTGGSRAKTSPRGCARCSSAPSSSCSRHTAGRSIEPRSSAPRLTPAPPSSSGRNATTWEEQMQITRNGVDTAAGPSEWFTGTVYLDAVAAPSDASRLTASSVHFMPGARTAWHTHPNGQTIFVVEGMGLAQRRGGPVEVIRSGDRVFFEPGEEHWHGAAPTRFMTHLAMLEVDANGTAATWGDHVTDEEYGAATSSDD